MSKSTFSPDEIRTLQCTNALDAKCVRRITSMLQGIHIDYFMCKDVNRIGLSITGVISALVMVAGTSIAAENAKEVGSMDNESYQLNGVAGWKGKASHLLIDLDNMEADSIGNSMSASGSAKPEPVSGRAGISGTRKLAPGSTSLVSSSTIEKSSGCNTVWNVVPIRWKGSNYIPRVYHKVRLWLDTKTFKGTASNPETCNRAPHYSQKLRHLGSAIGDDGFITLARINSYERYNSSHIWSYRKSPNYGNAAVSVECASGIHYIT